MIIEERQKVVDKFDEHVKRLLSSVQQLDSKDFVKQVTTALKESTTWEPEERLAFNRWLSAQGVSVVISAWR